MNMNGVIQRDTAERQDLTKEKEKGILDTKGQGRQECVTWQNAQRDAHHICMGNKCSRLQAEIERFPGGKKERYQGETKSTPGNRR